MGKFILRDKHIAFLNEVIAGMPAYKAFIKHVSPSKHIKKSGASVSATQLMQRPEMIREKERIQLVRSNEISKIAVREVAEIFRSTVLEPTELDAYNSAIIQGKVEVEDVVPQWNVEEKIDPNTGKVIGRRRSQSFVKVKRPPNIKEKQASMDMLYKRRGSYAPLRAGVLFKNADGEGMDPDEMPSERMVIMSDGTKVTLFDPIN